MIKISDRQAGILIFISIITLKFVTFPSVYAEYAGIDGYWGITFSLVFDFIVLALLLFISHKNQNKTYEQLISEKFGNVTLKFVNFGLFLYFLFKSIFLIKENHNYLLETLFTYLPWQAFLLPFMCLMIFIMSKSLNSLGRSAEVFFFVILGALLIMLFLPIQYADFTNLLPMLESGTEPVMTASFHANFSSGDYLIFVMLMGRFKLQKKSHRKIFRFALLGAAIVIAFYVVYFSVFGVLAINQTLAISDLPLFVSFPTHVGRVDWIIINLWTISLVFQTGFLLSLCLYTFTKAFNVKNKGIGLSVITLFIVAGTYVLFLNLSRAVEIVTNPLFASINLIFQILIAFIVFLSVIKFRGKRNVANKKIMAK